MYTDPSINTCTLKFFMIGVSCPGTLILKILTSKQKKKGNNSQFKKILIGGGMGGGYFLCVRKSGVGRSPLDDTCLKPP